MPKHVTMWLATGGAVMLSAALAYVATRPPMMTAAARLKNMRGAFMTATRCRSQSKRPSSGPSATRSAPTGNAAFREYRESTLRRLDEEEREFRTFLERIRLSRDRAEMDAFLRERDASSAAVARDGKA